MDRQHHEYTPESIWQPPWRESMPEGARHFDWAALSVYNEHAGGADGAGEPGDWDDERRAAQDAIVGAFGFDASAIQFFSNATTAARRVILRLAAYFQNRVGNLLISDLEFPGIVALLDEHWPGPLYSVQVQQLIAAGRPEEIEEHFKKAVLLTQPDVVFLSHVARASGYVAPLSLLRWIRDWRPETIVVLDGSQAAGNVHINDELVRFHLASMYFFSGHKWLGGKPTLGVLVADERWGMADPAEGYSRKLGSAGSGDIEALRGLTRRIGLIIGSGNRGRRGLRETAKATSELGDALASKLGDKGLAMPPAIDESGEPKHNGIVCVEIPWPAPGADSDARARAEATASELFETGPNQNCWPGEKHRVTLLKREHWRGHEGWISSAERYRVRFEPQASEAGGLRPSVTDLRFSRHAWKWRDSTAILRVSVHGALHQESDLIGGDHPDRGLVERIARLRSKLTGFVPESR